MSEIEEAIGAVEAHSCASPFGFKRGCKMTIVEIKLRTFNVRIIIYNDLIVKVVLNLGGESVLDSYDTIGAWKKLKATALDGRETPILSTVCMVL
jgi:hypothetical protein